MGGARRPRWLRPWVPSASRCCAVRPLNRSRLATVVVVPVTGNMKWVDAPGNVLLPAAATGLPRDSVAQSSLIFAIDKKLLDEHVGKLPSAKLQLIVNGINVILGR